MHLTNLFQVLWTSRSKKWSAMNLCVQTRMMDCTWESYDWHRGARVRKLWLAPGGARACARYAPCQDCHPERSPEAGAPGSGAEEAEGQGGQKAQARGCRSGQVHCIPVLLIPYTNTVSIGLNFLGHAASNIKLQQHRVKPQGQATGTIQEAGYREKTGTAATRRGL